jgi:hypothetical protein
MIVTVLWEDSHGVGVKGFGPHELLVTYVAKELGWDRPAVSRIVRSLARNGVGNVRRALKNDLSKLTRSGPVVAVIDVDKAHKLWSPGVVPASCKSAMNKRIHQEVEGDFDLVFLEQNMESLLNACDPAGLARLGRKPTPFERDQILGRAASGNPATPMNSVLEGCPSFARLVRLSSAWVTALVAGS